MSQISNESTRRERRLAAKKNKKAMDSKSLRYLAAVSSSALISGGFVGVAPAFAFEETNFLSCMNESDIEDVPVSKTVDRINFVAVTASTDWSRINTAIVESQRNTNLSANPRQFDKVVLCADTDIRITGAGANTFGDGNNASVSLRNGTFSPAGGNFSNEITFEATSSSTKFSSFVNGGSVDFYGLRFSGFESVVQGTGDLDATIGHSYFSGGFGTQILITGANPISNNVRTLGSIDVSNSEFYSNTRAIQAKNVTDVVVVESTFQSNGTGSIPALPVPETGSPNDGSGIYVSKSNLDILDSKFYGNVANYGAAIFSDNSNAVIDRTVFTNNESNRGGAIFAENDSVFTVLSTPINDPDNEKKVTSFNQNFANYSGGAIHSSDSDFSIANTRQDRVRFVGNGVEILPTEIDRGNKLANVGGAIFAAKSSSFSLDGVLLEDNQAEIGGAIYSDESSISSSRDVTFDENFAIFQGGAVSVKENSSLSLVDSVFTANKAGSHEFEFYVDDSLESSSVSGYGGAIVSDQSELYIKNGDFTTNYASNSGGAIFATSADYNIDRNLVTLVGNDFVNNEAGTNRDQAAIEVFGGGAVFLRDANSSISGGRFDQNSAMDFGGAIYLVNGTTNIDGVLLNENFTAVKVGENLYGQLERDAGGAIFSSNNALRVENSTLSANDSVTGGAISSIKGQQTDPVTGLIVPSTVDKPLVLVNSNFSNNTAVDGGGAVKSETAVTITGGAFSGNYTDSGFDDDAALDSFNSGGAVLASGSVSITGASFSNNVAPGVGGAVSSGDDVDVTGSTFTGNQAGGSGGAIYAGGTFSSVSSSFSSNESFNSGGAVVAYGDVTVSSGSIFQSNSAGSGEVEDNGDSVAMGGAIAAFSNATVSDSFFTLNSAVDDGGAIFAFDVTVQGSTFRENSSGKDGGAIFHDGDLQINASNFASNSASDEGGAVYSILASSEGMSPFSLVEEEVSAVRNSFFKSNTSSQAGAIYFEGSEAIVSRSTFENNTGTPESLGQSIFGGSILLANNTFVSNFTDGTAVRTYGDVVFNTFVGGEDYDSIGYDGEIYDSQLVLGNIFPGGTEQFLDNAGKPVLVEGVPAWRYFAGAHLNEERLVFEDVRRDANGNPIDEYDRIIAPVDYDEMKESTYRESQVFDSEDRTTWNFFTSSMTRVSSGEFQLHYTPTSPLAKDFVVGNLTLINDVNSENDDVRTIVANDAYMSGVWEELTAVRPTNPSAVPAGVIGPRVGSDRLGTIRTFAWDAGAIEMGTRISAPTPVTPTPPPAPSFGGGFAGVFPPAAVVTFEPVRASVRGFAANSSRLTAGMRSDLRKLVRQNPGATSVTCKGFTSAPPTAGDARLSRQRGKAICDFVKKLNPELTVKVLKGAYEDVPGSQIRRVRVVLR